MLCEVCRQPFTPPPRRQPKRFCSDRCRMAAHRAKKKPPVTTVTFTDNADLLATAAKLFLHDGMRVADVTYGKGIFWRKIDTSRFWFIGSDIRDVAGVQVQCDFRCLPYADACFDALVLDPPYLHSPPAHAPACRAASYANAETTGGLLHADIMRLYAEGMGEAARVLKPRGFLFVKCKDQVQQGKNRWAHTEIKDIAAGLGFTAVDMLILVPASRSSMGRWERQVHARKVHSYLWIFRLSGGNSRRGTHRNKAEQSDLSN